MPRWESSGGSPLAAPEAEAESDTAYVTIYTPEKGEHFRKIRRKLSEGAKTDRREQKGPV